MSWLKSNPIHHLSVSLRWDLGVWFSWVVQAQDLSQSCDQGATKTIVIKIHRKASPPGLHSWVLVDCWPWSVLCHMASPEGSLHHGFWLPLESVKEGARQSQYLRYHRKFLKINLRTDTFTIVCLLKMNHQVQLHIKVILWSGDYRRGSILEAVYHIYLLTEPFCDFY